MNNHRPILYLISYTGRIPETLTLNMYLSDYMMFILPMQHIEDVDFNIENKDAESKGMLDCQEQVEKIQLSSIAAFWIDSINIRFKRKSVSEFITKTL